MTGGIIVVLGSTGRNVGAGMTGGITFLLDESNKVTDRVNQDNVGIYKLCNESQESLLKAILKSHLDLTKSKKAKEILSNWEEWKEKFKMLVPPSEKEKLGLKI